MDGRSGGWANWSLQRAAGALESREVEATLHSILGLRLGRNLPKCPLLRWRLDWINPGFNRAFASARHGQLKMPRHAIAWVDLPSTRQVFYMKMEGIAIRSA